MKVAEAGAPAAELITASADAGDTQPEAFATVKLCVPGASPEMVVDVVFPFIPPGLIVQLPEGNPERATLPVATPQVACVIVPMTGAVGVAGWGAITTSADADEMHPAELVTVKLYVPSASDEMVVVAVTPVIPPGFIVQLPAGRPERTTLPVAVEQVGCVMVPAVGAPGVTG